MVYETRPRGLRDETRGLRDETTWFTRRNHVVDESEHRGSRDETAWFTVFTKRNLAGGCYESSVQLAIKLTLITAIVI